MTRPELVSAPELGTDLGKGGLGQAVRARGSDVKLKMTFVAKASGGKCGMFFAELCDPRDVVPILDSSGPGRA